MIENSEWATRIEDKIDRILDAMHAQDLRLTKVESQLGFAKWLGGTAMTLLTASVGWLIKHKA